MGKRGALLAAAVATAGLVVAGVWGGLALAGPSRQAPTNGVIVPVYSDNSVTTTTTGPAEPATASTGTSTATSTTASTTASTTTTTSTVPQPPPAIGAPAGCRYSGTCSTTTTIGGAVP